MKREDTKTKVNDPMSTVPTDKKLKRYDMSGADYYGSLTVEAEASEDGDWVRYDDHETAVRELAEQLEEARGIMKALQSVREWAQANPDSPVSARIQYDHVAQDAYAFLSRTSPTDPTPPEK